MIRFLLNPVKALSVRSIRLHFLRAFRSWFTDLVLPFAMLMVSSQSDCLLIWFSNTDFLIMSIMSFNEYWHTIGFRSDFVLSFIKAFVRLYVLHSKSNLIWYDFSLLSDVDTRSLLSRFSNPYSMPLLIIRHILVDPMPNKSLHLLTVADCILDETNVSLTRTEKASASMNRLSLTACSASPMFKYNVCFI